MRLHQTLFYLLVALLPVQLGRHFWPDFAFVSGIRVDYLAPTVYLTDLLVVGILGAWLYEIRDTRYAIRKFLKHHWWVVVIFVYLLITSLLAQNFGAALYKFIKIAEFALLGFYVARNRYQLSIIHYPLSIAIVCSSLLAFAQFLKQASLGGHLWWLGERTFNLSTPGIARAIWDGRLILRPYATFPHPNVLAGFLLIGLILTVPYFVQRRKGLVISYLLLVISAIACSFSRSIWIVGLIISSWSIANGLWKSKNNYPLYAIRYTLLLVLSLFVLGAIFYSAFQLSTEETVVQRLQLNQAAIEMIKQNPVIGVGLNNFIPQLPHFWPSLSTVRFLQPVHNIFLLVAAETGLVGLMIFLWLLALTFKRIFKLSAIGHTLLRSNKLCLCAGLTAILLLGLFDHYWLTLQQTQLLFAVVLGLSWTKKKDKMI